MEQWAINELLKWKNTEKLYNRILKIAGTHDKLLPPVKDNTSKLIEKGEHFMIVDRADEISALINKEICSERPGRF